MVIIIGAGDGGRELLDILGSVPCVFVDDDKQGQYIGFHRVVGKLEWLKGKNLRMVCSIHDPEIRSKVVGRVLTLCGGAWKTVVSKHAMIAPSASLGDGCIIYPGAVIGTDVSIANHCIVDKGATLSHDVCLDGFCTIGPGAHLAGHVRCGARSCIGMGACILPGVTIGQHAVVGAGAVVLEDVPAESTVAGVPAKMLRGVRRDY